MSSNSLRPHLLIIDDRPDEMRLLLETLRSEDYRISVAFDGEQGYRRAIANRPDLILLDVRMPRLGGFATSRQLKAYPAPSRIPVIFLPSSHELAARLEGLGAGAVDYVTKPFAPEEVLARIRIHLQLATGTTPQAVNEEPDITSHDLVIVRAAMKYMAENIARPISLEDISRHIGTYEKKLSNAFRTHTGKSVFEYLREERLCRARQLLSTTPLSIHEIALEVGFSSAANFATSFRDRFDTTPSEFRKNPDG